MSREIKFRAWDKKAHRFLDENDNTPNFLGVVPCDTTGQFTPMYMTIEETNVYDTDLDIQFYTGLKDKNGKEIYEGDVVKREYRDFKVVYSGAAFRMDSNDESTPTHLPILENKTRIEVIGNIMENPELLK